MLTQPRTPLPSLRPPLRRLTLALPLVLLAGCNVIGPMAYYLGPRRIQKPEFDFPSGARLAVVIDAAEPRYENPVFNAALQKRMAELMREGKCDAQLIPPDALARLRQDQPDFASWSLQRIGRELLAEYVLALRIERLTVLPSPDYPVLTPDVALRTKVIAVDAVADKARVWPDQLQEHPVAVQRPPAEAGDLDADALDRATEKLAYDAAWYVCIPFIEVDLEAPPPLAR